MKAKDRSTAQTLTEAMGPIFDICFELGIPGPEFERAVREAFVLHGFKKLPKHPTSGRPPTAHKVSLATGYSRAVVGEIEKEGALIQPSKTPEHSRGLPAATRVIEGWTADPKFQTSGGSPLDLPIKSMSGKRCFKDLVDKYAPSVHPGALIRELLRRGQIQVLEDDLVRFKRASVRKGGLNTPALTEASRRISRVAHTLYETLKDEKALGVAEETRSVQLTPEQRARLMRRIEQRVRAFLKSVESEFPTPHQVDDAGETRTFGVGVYSWDE